MTGSQAISSLGEAFPPKIFTITVAFSPAAQLARTLIQYYRSASMVPYKHVVVLGHYPINREKNNRDIEFICHSFPNITLMDPESNIGSAQSQNWVIDRLRASGELKEKDYMINLDPDSCCKTPGWDKTLYSILEEDKSIVLASCYSAMWERLMESRNQSLTETTVAGHRFGIPLRPTPFNLSLWRVAFLLKIGGIPQLGPFWGEVEGPFHQLTTQHGFTHGYALDVREEESGKFMQDKQFLEYKDHHMRTIGPEQFVGSFQEYLASKHPQVASHDTYISPRQEFQ